MTSFDIETNVTHTAWKTGVGKLMFLGSAGISQKSSDPTIPI